MPNEQSDFADLLPADDGTVSADLVASVISDPERQKLVRDARIECLREDIRAGNETALWEYVGLQWPDAILDEFQRDIIRSALIDRVRIIGIKGCTGPGKGFAVATLANIIFDCWEQTKILVTSSDISQAVTVMFGEIKAVHL